MSPAASAADDQQVSYRLAPAQRTRMRRVAGYLLIVPAVGIVATWLAGPGPWTVLVLLGVGFAVATVALVYPTAGRTVVDGAGIHANRPLSRHHYRWADITAVEVVRTRDRSGVQTRLAVRTGRRRPHLLPAPRSYSLWADPRFEDRATEIILAARQRQPGQR
ncbi:PH domain-containing protein [Solihabitans fulvus]|uniref:PH domain-containing protein n=1 Tax=Solihabitans fulvus TaxID=1892852 RepID=UPI001661B836|nr:PH domain-containing protein [Solihabitans fulvus]